MTKICSKHGQIVHRQRKSTGRKKEAGFIYITLDRRNIKEKANTQKILIYPKYEIFCVNLHFRIGHISWYKQLCYILKDFSIILALCFFPHVKYIMYTKLNLQVFFWCGSVCSFVTYIVVLSNSCAVWKYINYSNKLLPIMIKW